MSPSVSPRSPLHAADELPPNVLRTSTGFLVCASAFADIGILRIVSFDYIQKFRFLAVFGFAFNDLFNRLICSARSAGSLPLCAASCNIWLAIVLASSAIVGLLAKIADMILCIL